MKKRENTKYGINMKQYCREHESAVLQAIENYEKQQTACSEINAQFADHHMEMIRRMQHERLVHLIVTLMVVIAELFVTGLAVVHPELGIIPPIAMLALAVLLAFYFYHYFFLENTVQRWYKLADTIESIIKP